MTDLLSWPYLRIAGEGPVVLCLHSSAGSSKQWQDLAERLSRKYCVVAIDLVGYGKSPSWGDGEGFNLEKEVNLLNPIFLETSGPMAVVGHSYGGAVALKAALMHPDRVRSLAVYEPVFFSLLFENFLTLDIAREVWNLQAYVRHALDERRPKAAARRFVDYWSGQKSWVNLPEWKQAAITEKMDKVRYDFEATVFEATPSHKLRGLNIPALILHGTSSPEPVRQIARNLEMNLSEASLVSLRGLGHMGPITHPHLVNNLIIDFLHYTHPWRSVFARG